MKKQRLIHLFISLIVLVVIVFSIGGYQKVFAAYNYGPDGVVESAESIVVTQVIDTSNLCYEDGTKVPSTEYTFGEIADVAMYGDKLYVSDSSNNVVVIFNDKYQYLQKFPTEDSGIKLVKPNGLYVTEKYIYVCDYGQNRVAIFDRITLNLVQEVLTPEDSAFENYEFRPKKITVTRTGRMYVIAEGINEGIIGFNADGTFSRYYGMNSVTVSAWQAFWLLFTSEEQRKVQGSNFGASLSNLCIDKDEYVYTVSSSSAGQKVIKKLNYKGTDILTRNGYVPQNGDILTEPNAKPTNFVDIDVNDIGTYIALDSERGRIFAYDFEGNLLYIGGKLGNAVSDITSMQTGTFQSPKALCYFKDNIVVIDSLNKNVTVFGYTDFGRLVNQATKYYYENDYINAGKIWEKVLAANANYYLAYAGIGKAQLRSGEYEKAMANLKLGYDTYNYSNAYKLYRYEKMSIILPYLIGGVMIIGILLGTRSIIKAVKKSKTEGGNK